MSARDAFLKFPHMLNVPWVQSPFFERQLAESDADEQHKAYARQFHDQGYVVLENLIEDDLVDDVAGCYDWLFDEKTKFKHKWGQPRILTHDPGRRQDAWTVHKGVKRLACHPRILDVLRFLYRREPVPFQTLNFRYGTEQSLHSDAIHFSCVPAGFMCGVWVALEDVSERNGTLCYVPGSHKLPEISLEQLGVWPPPNSDELGSNYELYEEYVRAIVAGSGLPLERLDVKKGSALVWAANLLHGGTKIGEPGSTRLSQVTHYYFEDCAYYTPIFSKATLGELRLKGIYDIARGRGVKHTINGTPLETIPLADGNHRVTLPATATVASS